MKRIVVARDSEHGGMVAIDDEPPKLVDTAQASAWEVWVADEDVSRLEFAGDAAQARPWNLTPPSGGSAFRLIEFNPNSTSGMHSTQTLDYVVIVSGRIVLGTPERDVELGPGDVVVQLGAEHEWRNDFSEPCLAAAILLDAA